MESAKTFHTSKIVRYYLRIKKSDLKASGRRLALDVVRKASIPFNFYLDLKSKLFSFIFVFVYIVSTIS